jgi:hypothetical protein
MWLRSARQATLPRGSFWRAKLTTSDDFDMFFTHVTTFHDHLTTLTTACDDTLTTLTTFGEDLLTTLTTFGDDLLTTRVTTNDYLLTTPHDDTDDPRDDLTTFHKK